MTRTAWFDDPLPRILAHRGLATNAPQNSIEAFRAAIDAGATHLETDARATSDGQAVLVHDPQVGQGSEALDVSSLTLDALRRRLSGVCTVEEALSALPDARFNIDLKSADAVAPAVRAIRTSRAMPRVLVTSFSARRRLPALRALQPIATSASAREALPAIYAARVGAGWVTRRVLRGSDAVQLPERALGLDVTTPAMVDRLHRAGVEVHVWVVNDSDRMRELVANGVDGIVTDRADIAAQALR